MAAPSLLLFFACSAGEGDTPDVGPRDATVGPILYPDASTNLDAGDLGTAADSGAEDAANQCVDGPRKPLGIRAGIVNGTRAPNLVPLSAEQRRAVVGVGQVGVTGAVCSGTLIAEQVVLTATHCTEGIAANQLRIIFGEDDLSPELVVPVASKREHPTQDLALLTTVSAPSAQLAVLPIPIFLGTLTAADVGREVETAGYGDTESNEWGRFFAIELLISVDAQTFTVDGQGLRGVCFGDSGGPAFLVAPEGDPRTLGDLSEGDAECGYQDTFVRADVLRPWIEETTGPTPGANNLPCGGLGLVGACSDNVARWCEAGVVVSRDCGVCGETCLYLGGRQGYDCSVDPLACGELDYLGRCDGDVSEWCNEEDRRERLDCGAQGQICRYIDAETGYYCADP
ncbi:MAG: trypsin-like serine protease [Deltaproteobacteria bacterium]|nr:trypsin-like serine protease [Deltaproteobacteria bacterium]